MQFVLIILFIAKTEFSEFSENKAILIFLTLTLKVEYFSGEEIGNGENSGEPFSEE